ncbi:MAG: OmpH family outer membrane protein [Candidatus Babeliales bacterium]
MKKTSVLLSGLLAGTVLVADQKKEAAEKIATVTTTAEKAVVITPMGEEHVRSIVRQELEKMVAFLDPMKIFETDEMKEGLQTIEKTITEKKREIMAVEKEGMQKKAAFEQMAAALDDKAREKRIEELAKLEAEYRSKAQSAQSYAERAQEELRNKGLQKLQAEVTKLAQAEGYSMIFAGGVVYGSKPNDVTDKVVVAMNDTFRTGKKDSKAVETVAQKAENVLAKAEAKVKKGIEKGVEIVDATTKKVVKKAEEIA